MKFSTKDQDNDKQSFNCSANRGNTGWWFNACTDSNLNGNYNVTTIKGVFWLRSYTSFVEMKIRRNEQRLGNPFKKWIYDDDL